MRIGVALSGGGIRGIAHAGALKALEENKIKIDLIGGTSSGSMITVLYALGYKPDEIYNMFKKYASTIVKLNGNTIRREIKNFITRSKIKCQGINNGKFIEEIFNKIAAEKNVKNIKDLTMPIVIPCVDIANSKEFIFSSVESTKGNYISDIEVGKAVRASSSFPIIYEPMKYGECLLSDGGILNNIPVKEVKELGADKVIAIKFDSDKLDNTSNAIDIVMKVADIMGMQSLEENLNNTDYIINIPTDGTGILDVSKIDYCFKSGYETTKSQIQDILNICK